MARFSRTTFVVGVSALLLPALLLSGCTTKVVTTPAGTATANTVTASGSGTVSAVPDVAVMSFGVSANSSNAKSALDGVSSKATKVSDALKKAGVADKDIQTQNISIYPQNDSTGKVTGYQASLSVSAKVRDLSKLSSVIGAASSAGVDSISGPTFSVSEDAPYTDQAVQKAVDDARRKATAMAKAAGKSVGAVVSMTDNGAPVGPIAFSSNLAAGAAKSVPVQPGQLDVTSNLTVVFELK